MSDNINPEVAAKVAAWNAQFPVGTPVRYWPMDRTGEGIESQTRTPAWVIHGGHSALVSVEGRTGGIILSHVEPVITKPGEFCERHFSWLCGNGQGQCQAEVAA